MDQDLKTKHIITSFAAPTAKDVAYFNALSDEEKQEILLAELEDDNAKTVSISKDLSSRLFANALERSNDQ